MLQLHPSFLSCSCYSSFSMCDRASSGGHSFFPCVSLLQMESHALPLSLSLNSRPQWGERISARAVNKTLLLLHNVGESATVLLLWHLRRLITAVKAAPRDLLSLRATRLSCRGPGGGSRGWTVSGGRQRDSRVDSIGIAVLRWKASSPGRLKTTTWGNSHAFVWGTFTQDRKLFNWLLFHFILVGDSWCWFVCFMTFHPRGSVSEWQGEPAWPSLCWSYSAISAGNPCDSFPSSCSTWPPGASSSCTLASSGAAAPGPVAAETLWWLRKRGAELQRQAPGASASWAECLKRPGGPDAGTAPRGWRGPDRRARRRCAGGDTTPTTGTGPLKDAVPKRWTTEEVGDANDTLPRRCRAFLFSPQFCIFRHKIN